MALTIAWLEAMHRTHGYAIADLIPPEAEDQEPAAAIRSSRWRNRS